VPIEVPLPDGNTKDSKIGKSHYFLKTLRSPQDVKCKEDRRQQRWWKPPLKIVYMKMYHGASVNSIFYVPTLLTPLTPTIVIWIEVSTFLANLDPTDLWRLLRSITKPNNQESLHPHSSSAKLKMGTIEGIISNRTPRKRREARRLKMSTKLT
jgi:hypothetical protein